MVSLKVDLDIELDLDWADIPFRVRTQIETSFLIKGILL